MLPNTASKCSGCGKGRLGPGNHAALNDRTSEQVERWLAQLTRRQRLGELRDGFFKRDLRALIVFDRIVPCDLEAKDGFVEGAHEALRQSRVCTESRINFILLQVRRLPDGPCLSYHSRMKPISDARTKEIAEFSATLRSVGSQFEVESDAERIRLLAELLEAGEPAVKKWWYAQNAPRGGAARSILKQLRTFKFAGALPDDCVAGLRDQEE